MISCNVHGAIGTIESRNRCTVLHCVNLVLSSKEMYSHDHFPSALTFIASSSCSTIKQHNTLYITCRPDITKLKINMTLFNLHLKHYT